MVSVNILGTVGAIPAISDSLSPLSLWEPYQAEQAVDQRVFIGLWSNPMAFIKVSAEDNRTRLRFQLRTIGHITLVGCARNREGGCSILHSSHWDSLEDLSQTSGSGQVFFRTDLVCCGISPRFPLGNRKEVEIVFTLSHIWLLTWGDFRVSESLIVIP